MTLYSIISKKKYNVYIGFSYINLEYYEYTYINTYNFIIGDNDNMVNTFLFSRDHLTVLFFFALFLYFSPKLTKNLLPYSYIVEKVICILMILEIVFEQAFILSVNNYSTLSSLPIDICRFAEYICIAILFFKQYQLFNVYFSWSLVCSIGDLIFFKYVPYDFPNFLHLVYIFSNVLLLYANVYMVQVRKFKLNKHAILDNLLACGIYFSFIFLLNKLIGANYVYTFSSYNLLSILVFLGLTTLIYIPYYIFNRDESSFN